MRTLSGSAAMWVVALVAAACSGKFESTHAGPSFDAGSGGSSATSGGTRGSSGGVASGSGGSRSSGGRLGTAGGGAGGSVVGPSGGNSGTGTGGASSADASTGDSRPPSSCDSPSDCPLPATVCQTPVCLGHQCGSVASPSAVPPENRPGDCVKIVCTQLGTESTIDDPSDSSDDNECTVDSCQGGTASHQPSLGAQCSSGYCDAAGRCVECVDDNQCPQGSTECSKAKCVQGACRPVPPGTLCNGNIDQCNDQFKCVDCWDNGGCDELSVCSNQICIPA